MPLFFDHTFSVHHHRVLRQTGIAVQCVFHFFLGWGVALPGQDLLLEIDWQGARQVRELWPQSLSIFILPPSRAELERRLRNRASDSSEQIARRIADSRTEIAHASEFDYLVINDDFALAVTDLRAIVQARRLRCDVQQVRHAALMDDLLKPA